MHEPTLIFWGMYTIISGLYLLPMVLTGFTRKMFADDIEEVGGIFLTFFYGNRVIQTIIYYLGITVLSILAIVLIAIGAFWSFKGMGILG
jgi:hypothetical protein